MGVGMKNVGQVSDFIDFYTEKGLPGLKLLWNIVRVLKDCIYIVFKNSIMCTKYVSFWVKDLLK